jgi:putative ABC transport system ATP-binding protein
MADDNGKNGDTIIRLEGVGKSFYRGKERLDVLKNLDLTVPTGSFEALMGPSGSGKSTLLNLIARLDAGAHGSRKRGASSAARQAFVVRAPQAC